MHASLQCLAGLLALGAVTTVTAQQPVIIRSLPGRVVTAPGTPAVSIVQGGGPAPAAAATDAPPDPRLQPMMQLKFDRRPSARLAAWAAAEPESPASIQEKIDALQAKIEARQKELGTATPAQTPGEGTGAQTPPSEDDADAPSTITEGPEATEPAPVGGEEPATPAGTLTLAPSTSAATGVFVPAQPTTPPAADPTVEETPSTAEAAPTPAEPATAAPTATPTPAPQPAADPELAAWQKELTELQAEKKKAELELYQRHVTLGRWVRVGETLDEFEEKQAMQLYEQLLKALPTAPRAGGNNRVPANLLEQNTFDFQDLVGLLAAAPAELKSEQVALLGGIAQRALQDGHAIEELLVLLREETARDQAERVVQDRHAALLLAATGNDRFLGEFLPDREAAVAANDREALNLLSRYHLALYGREQKVAHLEDAWHIVQAALADGEIEEDAKQEALRRAVELAPKIREELGEAWLAESFTERPERGMEVIATIGAQASKAMETHAQATSWRLTGLQLQQTAVEALLGRAPERAREWRPSLNLLAANWLAEANHAYRFSSAESLGPRMQRDAYGNIFYIGYSGNRGPQSPVRAIDPGELLKITPSEAWQAQLDDSLTPRFATVVAKLYLKVNEEALAFPFIEKLAATHAEAAGELAEEFLRVWTKNHNPNSNNMTDPYMFMYGFNQRANGIPLTRSKQQRNLKDLAGWVRKLRSLPIEDLDEQLLVSAFTASHSQAEVYRLEAVREVFGELDAIEPQTLAKLVQQMRSNLVSVWRQPAVQEQNKTKRRQKDLQQEVLRGYSVAREVIAQALTRHPDEWALHVADAALAHDENDFRQEAQKSSEFAPRRLAALQQFVEAARLYTEATTDMSQEDESTEAFETWFYAALGSCELSQLDERSTAVPRHIGMIRDSLAALPGEIGERHRAKFASSLFNRLSAVRPQVKHRYLEHGFAIVGDHPAAHEARKVFDYYSDLVTEIQLVANVDGDSRVGTEPFGVRIDLRHTREIERESGGFAKYLQNQNNTPYAYNYGRPTENYRDKFQEAASRALMEHFEVLSVTFNSEDVHSKATEEYGWRVTPYAYLLLRARGPQIDTIPTLQLDMDFLDTSGYAVLPVGSAPVAIDASSTVAEPRPYEDLEVTQILDERRADEGVLVLEIKGTAKGLVPDLEEIVDLAPSEFDVQKVDDRGVLVSQFDEGQEAVISERTWMVTLQAKPGLPAHPTTFEFAEATDSLTEVVYQRYADADLVTAERVANLDERYGEPSSRWPWLVGGALLLALLALLLWHGLRSARRAPVAAGRTLPDTITPFTVLGLLRDLQRCGGLSDATHGELRQTIDDIERRYFGNDEPGDGDDLRRVAEDWLRRAG